MRKIVKYPTMKCYKETNCPCYEGDGYTYRFDSIEFNFCDICNKKLMRQMVEQFKLEEELTKKVSEEN